MPWAICTALPPVGAPMEGAQFSNSCPLAEGVGRKTSCSRLGPTLSTGMPPRQPWLLTNLGTFMEQPMKEVHTTTRAGEWLANSLLTPNLPGRKPCCSDSGKVLAQTRFLLWTLIALATFTGRFPPGE